MSRVNAPIAARNHTIPSKNNTSGTTINGSSRIESGGNPSRASSKTRRTTKLMPEKLSARNTAVQARVSLGKIEVYRNHACSCINRGARQHSSANRLKTIRPIKVESA